MVEKVVNKLKEMKQLDNTYIVYASDNGFHLGMSVVILLSLVWSRDRPRL